MQWNQCSRGDVWFQVDLVQTCFKPNKKANNALHAIKLIKIYFTPAEILTLITSNYYSILYCNSEVWHLPTLNPQIKQHLLSASANALKLAQCHPDPMESIKDIHFNMKRATPENLLAFKHSVLLHKLYNDQSPNLDWVDLNFKQTFTTSNCNIIRSNNYKISNNILSNRLSILNNKIILNDLNLFLNSFKTKYKLLIL